MTVITLTADIAATPHQVYDYVTRPVRWKEWHPASQGVSDVDDESLVAGRRFEEDVLSAGRRRHLTWLVEESRPGQRWRASAYMADGSTVRLTYEMVAGSNGTRFTRTLEYTLRPLLLRWLNDLFLWKRVRAESEAALANLCARLSGQQAV
ncbi:MAG TPA: SRPBCC family protein [Candidatus Kapabacteria bacterium]|nr:SRPBCC family protein [Candidatus Kapabacteria bacterium]